MRFGYKSFRGPEKLSQILNSRCHSAHMAILGNTFSNHDKTNLKCFLLGKNRRSGYISTFGGLANSNERVVDTLEREGREEHHNIFGFDMEDPHNYSFALQRFDIDPYKDMYSFVRDFGDLDHVEILREKFHSNECLGSLSILPEDDDNSDIVAIPVNNLINSHMEDIGVIDYVEDIDGEYHRIRDRTIPTITNVLLEIFDDNPNLLIK